MNVIDFWTKWIGNSKVGIMTVVVISVMAVSACVSESEPEGNDHNASSEIIQINALISNEPENAEALIARANYHYARKSYADATIDVAAAMRLDSINKGYHHLLSDIYLDANKSELALRTLERVIRLFPNSIESNLKIAELQIILRQYTAASTSLRNVLEVAPQNIEAMQLLGILFKEQGEIERAAQSFQRVVDLDGDNYEAWTMLGNLLDILGDPVALQCFENAIDIDSTYSQGWHSKAYYLQNHGDIEQAIAIYHKIQHIDSTYTDAYLNAGILYLDLGEFLLAEQEFGALTRIEPGNSLGPYYLGVSLEEREDYQSALDQYRIAAEISPRSAQSAEAVMRMEVEINK